MQHVDFSLFVALGLSCPAAALRVPNRDQTWGPLHWKALDHQGSRKDILFLNVPFSSSLELLSLHTGTTTCCLGAPTLRYGCISEKPFLVPLPSLYVTLHLIQSFIFLPLFHFMAIISDIFVSLSFTAALKVRDCVFSTCVFLLLLAEHD